MRKAVISIISIFLVTACNNSQKFDIKSAEQYEKGKESLEIIEQKTPQKFISVTGSSHKNLLGQTVVRGVVANHAKIVTFKDVSVRITFYSKTGALLEQDDEVVYETLDPGSMKSFKSKFFAPKGTDSVAFKMLNAKY